MVDPESAPAAAKEPNATQLDEEAEEETKEHDPVVRVDPREAKEKAAVKGKNGKKVDSRQLKKKPANRVSKSPRKSTKKERGVVVQEIIKEHGWKVQQFRTPKGRLYWKWIHPDGSYVFSKVQAEALGFTG